MIALSPQQVAFFDTFGFLKLAGAVKENIEEIIGEFTAVFPETGAEHDGKKRTCIVPFVDQREKLCALLDDPIIEGAASSLIGADFNYIGSDGNYYTGDTWWHSDGYHEVGKYIKMAFYLDSVTKDTGALRVIPGSHRLEMRDWPALKAGRSHELWDIGQSEVPGVALESEPGDVLIFNHNLMHGSFGGSSERRMFTLNLCRRAENQAEVDDLKDFIAAGARFWIDRVHGETMRRTASPMRAIHLQQVIENEGHLAALAARARETQSEPARG